MANNNILKYTSKDYTSILNDLIDAIPSLTDLWTSREDGDPGIVLVKLISALGDMLSYNLDKQALEYYSETVTQRKNASKLYNLIGYNMHWYRTAQTQVTLTNKIDLPLYITFLKQVVDEPSSINTVYVNYLTTFYPDPSQQLISVPPQSVPLPNSMIADGVQRPEWNRLDPDALTYFNNAANLVYGYWQKDATLELHTYVADPLRSLEIYSNDASNIVYSLVPTDIDPGVMSGTNTYNPTIYLPPYEEKTFTAIQGTLCSTTFTPNQVKDCCFYVPTANLDESYMYLCYQTTTGNAQLSQPIFIGFSENLLLETDGQLHFQFRVDEFDYPYIELSSYWADVLEKSEVTFTFYYFKTLGSAGTITTNYLNRLNAGGSYSVEVTNIANSSYTVDINGNIISSPGYNPQTAQEAYVDAQNYIMTYNTLVTIYDFQRFCNRQNGISNSFVCDGQYAADINKEIWKVCNSYTVQQLQSILGITSESDKTTLATWLYRIRKINANYKQNCITKTDVTNPSGTHDGGQEQEYEHYSVQVAPIYGEFEVDDLSTASKDDDFAFYTNICGGTIEVPLYAPYMYYKIYESGDKSPYTGQDVSAENYKIATYLDEEFDKCRIVTALPKYVPIRVFPWRCCGTIHLNKSVPQEEADTILRNVVQAISESYSAENIKIGNKINYMTLIDIIMGADSRIRYFDAGLGDKKLVEIQVAQHATDYFNIEAYFNPASIMKYEQTYDEIKNQNSQYYNYISIDPSYIQTSN